MGEGIQEIKVYCVQKWLQKKRRRKRKYRQLVIISLVHYLSIICPLFLFLSMIIYEKICKGECSATSFLRNWDSILEKKRANLRSISEPARLRQPPPRSTGAAHARGRAQSIREERRIAAPPVLFALLWVRLLPALYGPFCGPLRPFGGCPWGVTPPARECLPPAPPDTRRRG